eukprot:3506368-Amphidinium_carterae.1
MEDPHSLKSNEMAECTFQPQQLLSQQQLNRTLKRQSQLITSFKEARRALPSSQIAAPFDLPAAPHTSCD